MFENKEEEIKVLLVKRDKIITGFFWLALKIAFIFGIPAFIGAYLGRKIDKANESGFTFTVIFLVVAFIVSWVFVYFEYKKISKKTKEIEDKIKVLREEIKS